MNADEQHLARILGGLGCETAIVGTAHEAIRC
jgi:hypothetical protein